MVFIGFNSLRKMRFFHYMEIILTFYVNFAFKC